jgi:hypothetical protein
MLRVAFDFGRPAHVAFDQNAAAIAFGRYCGREIKWFSRHDFFRLIDIGNNFLIRRRGCRTQAAADSR